MLCQQNGTNELAAAKREVLASRDAVYGMSDGLRGFRFPASPPLFIELNR